jgi:DNA invertase Pin-like site-specific DNA recombinase
MRPVPKTPTRLPAITLFKTNNLGDRLRGGAKTSVFPTNFWGRSVYWDMSAAKIAIYSRVSTDQQDNQNQLDQLRAFAQTQGWKIVHEFVDVGSGGNGDRQEFKALFAAASRREFGLVLFWSLDRFSREGVFETLQHLQRLTGYGVGYRSYSEQYLDSCGLFKDAVISILATIARQEKIRLSERTLAGLARARAEGRVGGRPRIQCNTRKLLKLRAAGDSLGTIATKLKLTKTTVHRILTAAQTKRKSR